LPFEPLERLHRGFRSGILYQMARKKPDLGIFWVVLLAAILWTAVWEHDRLTQLYRKSPVPAWLRHGQ
jgi:hypothetical protein